MRPPERPELHTVKSDDLSFIADDGEAARVIRGIDWADTPLGAASSWSPTLRTLVRFLLANRFPMLLWWGPDYIQLYNDAYAPILGTKHPWGMGLPLSQCWSEIWHVLKPLIDTPFNGGAATWMEDIELAINRHGFMEESHFTVAYSPVPDETAPRGIGQEQDRERARSAGFTGHVVKPVEFAALARMLAGLPVTAH